MSRESRIPARISFLIDHPRRADVSSVIFLTVRILQKCLRNSQDINRDVKYYCMMQFFCKGTEDIDKGLINVNQ